MKSGLANKSAALLALLVFGCCQAQPLQEGQASSEREKRQMKNGAATEADIKMLAGSTANVTPTATAMPMPLPMGMGLGMSMGMPQIPQMPYSPLAFNAGMQLARFPSYPGLIYGAGGAPGLQANVPNPYSNYDAGLAAGAANGFGLSYGGNAPNFMYGNVYSNGYAAPAPSNENFAALNNYFSMANAQGLAGGAMPPAFYAPQAGAGPVPQQLSPFGFGAGNNIQAQAMNAMNAYATGF